MTDPVAVPFYKSRILQGILTIVITQLVARIQSRYHVDFMGISVTDIVNWVMDALSTAGAYWAAHARVASDVPIPPVVTLTKANAQEINDKVPTLQPPPAAPSPTGVNTP